MRKHILLLFCILSAITVVGDVVSESRLNYRIILPDHATKVEIAAAEELKAYLGKIYTEPVRLNHAVPKQLTFLVGFSSEAMRAGFLDLPPVNRYPGGFGVFRRGDVILLAGEDDSDIAPWSYAGKTGTLLSVYYFLREYAGLNVFAPGAKGERLTMNPAISLPKDDLPNPAFEVRGIGLQTVDFPHREMIRFYKKMLCSVPFWAAPDFYYIILNKWDKRWKDRPELFALFNGKRFNGNYPYHIPCLTNPEVLRIVTSDLMEVINQRRNIRNIRMFCDAPVKQCECKNCAVFANTSDYYYTFINRVAKAIHQAYPDMVFSTQEKGSSYCTPPHGVKLEPNMVIEISTNFPEKRIYSENIPLYRQWIAAGARTTMRSYPRYPTWLDYPIINPNEIVSNLKTLKGISSGTRYSDGSHAKVPYSFCSLTVYIQARALFNPDLDVPAAIAEFCALAYPGAEKEMVEFYRVMEANRGTYSPWDNPLLTAYRPEKLIRPAQLLNDAAAKVKDHTWLAPLREKFEAFRKKTDAFREILGNYSRYEQEYQKTNQSMKTFPIGRTSASAPQTLKLFPLFPPETPFQESSVSCAYDDNEIRIVLHADETEPETIVRKRTVSSKRQAVWSDDCFEVMFAPRTGKYPYLQIGVNPNGEYEVYLHQTKDDRKALTPPLHAEASVNQNSWSVKFAVPRTLLREICPDGKGKIGVFRTRPRASKAVQSSGITMEGGRSYHEVATYKDFELVK